MGTTELNGKSRVRGEIDWRNKFQNVGKHKFYITEIRRNNMNRGTYIEGYSSETEEAPLQDVMLYVGTGAVYHGAMDHKKYNFFITDELLYMSGKNSKQLLTELLRQQGLELEEKSRRLL